MWFLPSNQNEICFLQNCCLFLNRSPSVYSNLIFIFEFFGSLSTKTMLLHKFCFWYGNTILFYILSLDVRFQENSKNDVWGYYSGRRFCHVFCRLCQCLCWPRRDIDANTERVTFSPGGLNLPANFFFMKFSKLAMLLPGLSWWDGMGYTVGKVLPDN